jgi:hypothetical protein
MVVAAVTVALVEEPGAAAEKEGEMLVEEDKERKQKVVKLWGKKRWEMMV